MAAFELIAMDGMPIQKHDDEKAAIAGGFAGGELTGTEREMLTQLQALREDMARMTSAILAQQSELAKLNAALSLVRVSRTQELAIGEAIRARAKEIARMEMLPDGAERRIASAIRATIRETTGARAIGDIQASRYEKVMALIGTWRMAGALRRIRKSMEDQA